MKRSPNLFLGARLVWSFLQCYFFGALASTRGRLAAPCARQDDYQVCLHNVTDFTRSSLCIIPTRSYIHVNL